jgi:hypothetical protein
VRAIKKPGGWILSVGSGLLWVLERLENAEYIDAPYRQSGKCCRHVESNPTLGNAAGCNGVRPKSTVVTSALQLQKFRGSHCGRGSIWRLRCAVVYLEPSFGVRTVFP